MLVSTKIASLFKYAGFVNVDYLVKNHLYVSPSRILNALDMDWRKWVKPILDPNFGYEIIGSNSVTISSIAGERFYGSVFPCPSAGTADSITCALKRRNNGSDNAKCAIYKHSDLSLTGQTSEVLTAMTTTFAWKTFPFSAPKPSLSVTDYIPVVWADYTTDWIALAYNGGDVDQGHYSEHQVYGAFPDPWAPEPFHNNNKYSIYCTYTLAAPPPKAGLHPSKVVPLIISE